MEILLSITKYKREEKFKDKKKIFSVILEYRSYTLYSILENKNADKIVLELIWHNKEGK